MSLKTTAKFLALVPVAALLIAVVVAGGCANKKKAEAAQGPGSDAVAVNPSVTDVGPGPQAFTPVPPAQPAGAYGNAGGGGGGAYSQAPVAPVYDPVVTQTPAPAPQYAAAPAGSSHTVRKGDTMYRIAIEKYGDGKKWTRIADANPGVSPTSLKVGQRLNIP